MEQKREMKTQYWCDSQTQDSLYAEGSLHLKKWNSKLHRMEAITVPDCEVSEFLTDTRRRYSVRGCASGAVPLCSQRGILASCSVCLTDLRKPSKGSQIQCPPQSTTTSVSLTQHIPLCPGTPTGELHSELSLSP